MLPTVLDVTAWQTPFSSVPKEKVNFLRARSLSFRESPPPPHLPPPESSPHLFSAATGHHLLLIAITICSSLLVAMFRPSPSPCPPPPPVPSLPAGNIAFCRYRPAY